MRMAYGLFIAPIAILLASASFAQSQVDPFISTIFQSPAFGDASANVRSTAEEIFWDRVSAERAYRRQDPPEAQNDKRVQRDTHGKTLAVPSAVFEVNTDVPERFRHGIFAHPGAQYSSLIRFANGVGQLHHDLYADARGFALKIAGVPGQKLLSEINGKPQDSVDILLNNAPTFFVGNAQDAKEFFSYDTNGDVSKYFIESLYMSERRKVAFNALYITKVVSNMLTETYWSGSAYKLGSQTVRYIVRPCAGHDFSKYSGLPNLNSDEEEYVTKMNDYNENFSAVRNNNPDFNDMSTLQYLSFLAHYPFAMRLGSQYADRFNPKTKNFLRENLEKDLSSGHEGCFEFGVQPYQSESTTPLIDPVAVWRSEPVWLAKVRVPQQTGVASPERIELARHLSFNPYHTLAENAPVGELNAIRGMVYEAMQTYRYRVNGESPVDFTPGCEPHLIGNSPTP